MIDGVEIEYRVEKYDQKNDNWVFVRSGIDPISVTKHINLNNERLRLLEIKTTKTLIEKTLLEDTKYGMDGPS